MYLDDLLIQYITEIGSRQSIQLWIYNLCINEQFDKHLKSFIVLYLHKIILNTSIYCFVILQIYVCFYFQIN